MTCIISFLDNWNWSPVATLPHYSLYSMGGHRNLLKPKSDLATLLSTLQGLPILVGEKNPLTSGPLVFLHSLAWGTQTFWFSHTSRAPMPGPLPLLPLCQLLFFQTLHGLPTMPCSDVTFLRKSSSSSEKAHSATCYPNILLNFSLECLPWHVLVFFFFCLPSVFLHRHTAPWELNFVPYFFST